MVSTVLIACGRSAVVRVTRLLNHFQNRGSKMPPENPTRDEAPSPWVAAAQWRQADQSEAFCLTGGCLHLALITVSKLCPICDPKPYADIARSTTHTACYNARQQDMKIARDAAESRLKGQIEENES